MIITIEIKGMEALIAKLKRVRPAITSGLLQAALEIWSDVREYTGDSHFTPFDSAKQRRWYWWAKPNPNPYSRTYNFKSAWFIQPVGMFEVHVANLSFAGPYIMGEKQTQRHKIGGWENIDAKEARYQKIADRVVKEHIDRALSG